jgi:hypothetical protein
VSITVDISEVIALTRAAERTLGDVGDDMKKILDAAAREERRTHQYRNRTRNLEESTFATEVRGDGDEVSVEIGARTHYASYVDNRGLMRIRELTERAATEIDYRFEGDADALGKL